MSKLVILALTVSIGTQSHSFFTYSDCDVECQSKEISCIISEQMKQYFACHCLQSENTCEMLATPRVVCLRPHGEPIGGGDIWSDFEHRNSTTTTAPPVPRPTVKPTPQPTRGFSKMAAMLTLAVILTAIASAAAVIKLRQRRRRRDYTRLPPSTTDSPYQQTVETLPQSDP